MKKMIIMTTAILSSVFVSGQIGSDDELAIRKIPVSIETSWNQKSGEGFASVFAETHDYIVVNGLYFSKLSRMSNANAHQRLFDGVYKTRNIRLVTDKVVGIRNDLAMVYIIGAGYENTTAVPNDPGIIMSLLVEKQKGEWKITSFHNHEIDAEKLKKESPMPLEVMYASWYKK